MKDLKELLRKFGEVTICEDKGDHIHVVIEEGFVESVSNTIDFMDIIVESISDKYPVIEKMVTNDGRLEYIASDRSSSYRPNNRSYYTPSIEEFHVGFEVEVSKKPVVGPGSDSSISDFGWELILFDPPFRRKGLINHLYHYRVRYLSEEDLKSLGFQFDWDNENGFISPDYNPVTSAGVKIYFTSEYSAEDIIQIFRRGDTVFSGVIKNKSELKRVLKMIGYEKKES